MTSDVEFRVAEVSDASAIAALHADSWRRHYRGAYSDAYLDGDIDADRLAVWTTRLGVPVGATVTVVAETERTVVGFGHAVLNDDPEWGTLIDNLHVAFDHKRLGIGTRLIAQVASVVAQRTARRAIYLWVLEQNTPAQAFYARCGGESAGKTVRIVPGGSEVTALRIAWPDLGRLLDIG